MSNRIHNGFTLIELLIAMGVMAFGILGFTFLNSRALQNRTYSRELNRSSLLANTFAENLISLPFNDALLNDDNSDSTASLHPGEDFSDGDTGSVLDFNYTIATYTSSFDSSKWFTVTQGNQTFYIRWEVISGNSSVSGTPADGIKIIRIFTAFEKKDPANNNLSLKGYNPVNIGPNIVTFKMDR
ncbi:MAG: prepilin-type N-terminal cleavage/methylation domain-containing protein [Deltaproteobacteria bacterium]|nr:prepilin-type N-terminal cleavage/methylation domain-containing protein [Deltaproteobacteria bacterium]